MFTDEFTMMIVGNLTWLMGGLLIIALGLRFAAFRVGNANQFYFKTFSRIVEKQIEAERTNEKINDIEDWLDDLLDRVMLDMPERNIRLNSSKESAASSRTRDESLEEFAHGKRSIIHSIKQQIDAFKSSYPPNFNEIASRVMARDRQSKTILKVLPLDLLTRVLAILPGLFVVGGIFGTFIGITNALPKIAAIDLNELDAAGAVMSSFVADIAYAMNTSIVGIICSVLMTVLNAMFPLATAQRSVMKNVEQILEMIWVRIHGGKIEAGDARMIELLEKIHFELSQTSTERLKKVS